MVNAISLNLHTLIRVSSTLLAQVRDECIVVNGEDACKKLIEAHKVRTLADDGVVVQRWTLMYEHLYPSCPTGLPP